MRGRAEKDGGGLDNISAYSMEFQGGPDKNILQQRFQARPPESISSIQEAGPFPAGKQFPFCLL